jgi:hypothetical protein
VTCQTSTAPAPSLLSSSSSLAFTHDVREKSYPIILLLLQHIPPTTLVFPHFLLWFFRFSFFKKGKKLTFLSARLFIRTPTDLHSIMYIVASRERLVPTSGVGCTRAEKKEKEIKTRPFLLLAESDQSQCLPYVVASSTLHIYTYVPSSYSAVGLFLSIPESVRHQRYLNTMQSLSAAQSILPSTWWISPYVCLDQWASGWVGGCRDNSRSRLPSQIGIWNRVKLKKRQWHQGVQKRRRIGQKK